MEVFYIGQSSFEHGRALDAPLSILSWTFESIELLQKYITSSLGRIKPDPYVDNRKPQWKNDYSAMPLDEEFEGLEDGMMQLLAHGQRQWWDHNVARVLDTLIREDLKECLALLATLHQDLMAIQKKGVDYKVDRGYLIGVPDPDIETEDELEEWETDFQEKIRKAEEMFETLLEHLQITKDEVEPARKRADERRAGSWIVQLEVTQTPPPEADMISSDIESHIARVSAPRDGDERPMNAALEELGKVARRIGRSLSDRIEKAQRDLEKGRCHTLVDTLFWSGDEKQGFLVGVAERVAKILRSHSPDEVRDHLVTELRATIHEVVGTPVWMIMSLFDQCVESAFGSSMDLEQMQWKAAGN